MELFNPFITTFFTAMLPFIEGKGSMLVGFALGLNVVATFVASVLGSCLPAPILLYITKPILEWLNSVPVFSKIVKKIESLFKRNAQKIKENAFKNMQNKYIKNKHKINNKIKFNLNNSNIILNKSFKANNSSVVDNNLPINFKIFALFAFVAIPLPGTGVWTGSVCATLLNIPYFKALPAIILGNIVTCLIVAIVSFGFFNIF
ncbi:MAG: small multi-drug export protein [Clostridia bacterium]|jgi:uncharacterized membrane protein|nr:small multi-drug export protein [Clostridia bacterium]